MKDRTIIGGVVYEGSEELVYNPSRCWQCVIRSEPEGMLFANITNTVRSGDPVATPNCAGLDGFACWRMDGIDIRDAFGRAVDSASILMPNHDAELVAVCVEREEDRARLYWYGTADVALDSDTDGDGYTFAQELAAGTNPLMKDRTIRGGIAYDDADTIEVLLQPIVCEGETLTAEELKRIRKAIVDANGMAEGVKGILISGPTGNIGLIADLGIAPSVGMIDADGVLNVTYSMPKITITSFDHKRGVIGIKVVPGTGNEIVSTIATGYVHVYGSSELGEDMQKLKTIEFDLTPYLKSESKGEASLTVELGSHSFFKVQVAQ